MMYVSPHFSIFYQYYDLWSEFSKKKNTDKSIYLEALSDNIKFYKKSYSKLLNGECDSGFCCINYIYFYEETACSVVHHIATPGLHIGMHVYCIPNGLTRHKFIL